ncbi:MAG: hypothetical protein A2289_22255 [Deltaproteobacteria bacterium RIFOXYA12_FULL_58_15]|nr:MAG: hypothetical protein A2289_22255 [Deltaproteobacteria bacterium RIFOXYA12_FULL_58_15]OGR14390.1 MAG: hypothetical protein A2341_01860 [Deltaproteobacteria bacterium RIFOXYB12_FULL_58_9]
MCGEEGAPSLRSEQGVVFDIQRFSIHDGPGIRTTVFLMGCNLRCEWCQNPESFLAGPTVIFDEQACTGCRQCAATCEHGAVWFNKGKRVVAPSCIGCGRCAATCRSNALEKVGDVQNVDAIIAEVLEDVPFYNNSGGGMTLSGGEPLLRVEFATTLLQRAKSHGIHTCVETAGAVLTETFTAVMPYVDLFYLDLKHMDEKVHVSLTGKSNQQILANADMLIRQGAAVEFRMPLIPERNDHPENLDRIAAFLRDHGVHQLRLLPYRPYYLDKLRKLGRSSTTASSIGTPTPADLDRVRSHLLRQRISTVVDA